LVAKLTGELAPHAGISITNILLSPDFLRMRGELMQVLARYPEAQEEVARPSGASVAGCGRDGRAGAKAIEARRPRWRVPLDLGLDLAHGLDPVAFAEDRLDSRRSVASPGAALAVAVADAQLLPTVRQVDNDSGRRAPHSDLRPGADLLVSPSLRQSKELFAKITSFLKDLSRRGPRGGQQIELHARQWRSGRIAARGSTRCAALPRRN
jgi:hypothetical protein